MVPPLNRPPPTLPNRLYNVNVAHQNAPVVLYPVKYPNVKTDLTSLSCGNRWGWMR